MTGKGKGKLANDPGAPAQPPWLQGYRSPVAESCPALLREGEPADSRVQSAPDQVWDVAGQHHDGAVRHHNGDLAPTFPTDEVADWPPQQQDPLRHAPASPPEADPSDPVEARAAELMRLVQSAQPTQEAEGPGRHRAEPDQQLTRPSAPPALAPPPAPPPARPALPAVRPNDLVQPLDEAAVANPGRYAPQSGWRRALYRASAGRLNPGDSGKDRRRDELFARIRQPIRGDFRIAVLSIKGGVGKTTTTLGLGSAFATIRTDRVIAVDANPDRGTLAQRINDPSDATVHDLLSDPNIGRYSDVRYYTRMSDSRLEVLGSPLDPAISEAFGEIDYRRTIDILQSYYNVILTDCGTGIMHSAMTGVLDLAHAIVVVSSPALDAARSASATLDWLMNHGYAGLVRESHLVLSAARPGESTVRMDKVYEHFESRCRSVHLIPFDSHLAEGAEVDMELLRPATFQAYVELAGAVSDKFARLRPNA